MFRAHPPRGGDTADPQDGASTYSLEGTLALGLCALVLLASLCLLERSSDYSRTLAQLAGAALEQPQRKREPRLLESRPPPALIVLVSLDTLRADHLGLYGYGRETAPNLRRLGEEGVVFETVAAQSAHTLISHKSMLTGKYPTTLMLEETGADLLELANVRQPREYLVDTLSHAHTSLAQLLGEHGYRTAGFTDGAWMSRTAGFDLGFETFDDSGGGLERILPHALGWLETRERRDEPAFLFVHAYDVHCPYPTREPFDSAFCPDHSAHIPLGDKCGKGPLAEMALTPADVQALTDHYDAGILSADDYLGRFLEELRFRGLYDRALLVVTSDHGESLGERGLVGHGGLYLEQLLVPLIVKFPRDWNLEPARISEPIELVDLLPTLLGACSFQPPRELDGRSLLPTLFRGVRGRDYLVAQCTFEEAPAMVSSPAKRTMLRPGRWQVIQDVASSEASFFGLEHDPAGLVPLSIAAEEFSALIDLLLERGRGTPHPARRSSPVVHFNAELERELGQLGYGGAAAAGQGPASTLR